MSLIRALTALAIGYCGNAAVVSPVSDSSYPLSAKHGVRANQRDAEKRRNRRRARRCVKR